MSMWRCPHCGTPQAETARCWVCHRSSTTCSTCRHFRRSVAAQVGFCGLDRRRIPLAGNEHRGCWESGGAQPTGDSTGAAPQPPRRRDPEHRRDFVPVELLRDRAASVVPMATGIEMTAPISAMATRDRPPAVSVTEAAPRGLTLFGEVEA